MLIILSLINIIKSIYCKTLKILIVSAQFFADVPVPDFKAEADAAVAKLAQQRAKSNESPLESQALANYLTRLKTTHLGHNTDDVDLFIEARRKQEAEEEQEAERLRAEKAELERLEMERTQKEALEQTTATEQVPLDDIFIFEFFICISRILNI